MKMINILLKSPHPAGRILSNLAESPFRFGGYNFSCVEAALQGIKFEDKTQREYVFSLDGKASLKEGRKITLGL